MNRFFPGLKCIAVMCLLCALLQKPACAYDAPATQPVNIEFLDGDAGKAAIIDDSIDPYFSRLEEHEMTAKTGSPITGETREAKIAQCKKRYQDAVLDFTDSDKRILSFFVSRIQGPLTRDYPLFGKTRFSFIKTKASLEGGMAYTRGSHVVLPERMLSQFAMFKQRMGDKALPVGASLLIHEQTHVLERLHPQLFTSLFTDTFHFVHANKIQANSWLTDRQLVNPDGTDCGWIFPMIEDGKPSFVLPLIAFDDPNPTGLTHGIGTIAVTMQQRKDGFAPVIGGDGNPIVRPLSDVAAYMEGPGSEGNNYHPNEITADRFAELVVFDDLLEPDTRKKMVGDNPQKMEQRLKPIRDWAKTAFAEAPPQK